MKGRWLTAVLFTVGAALILGAAAITGYSFISGGQRAKNAEDVALRLMDMMPEQAVSAVPDPERSDVNMSAVELDGQDYVGVLEIPQLGVKLPIGASWDKNGVRECPRRFSGSVWDSTLTVGASDSHFSFAHSVDAGTAVFVTDMSGRRFAYTVRIVERSKNADAATLASAEDGLSLFLRDEYTMEYLIVRCSEGWSE